VQGKKLSINLRIASSSVILTRSVRINILDCLPFWLVAALVAASRKAEKEQSKKKLRIALHNTQHIHTARYASDSNGY
jgi:hypothetical protein